MQLARKRTYRQTTREEKAPCSQQMSEKYPFNLARLFHHTRLFNHAQREFSSNPYLTYICGAQVYTSNGWMEGVTMHYISGLTIQRSSDYIHIAAAHSQT